MCLKGLGQAPDLVLVDTGGTAPEPAGRPRGRVLISFLPMALPSQAPRERDQAWTPEKSLQCGEPEEAGNKLWKGWFPAQQSLGLVMWLGGVHLLFWLTVLRVVSEKQSQHLKRTPGARRTLCLESQVWLCPMQSQ